MENRGIGRKNIDKATFRAFIPIEPPRNEYGLYLKPVMQPELLARANGKLACDLCNAASCVPDRHHVYWPAPTKSLRRKVARRATWKELPDYNSPQFKILRDLVGSTSGLICRSWHDELHFLQTPPLEIPDIEIAQEADEQSKILERIGSRIKWMTSYNAGRHSMDESKAKVVGKQQRERLERDLNNLPGEIILPKFGYWCVEMADTETGTVPPPPVILDVDFIRERAENLVA